MTPAQFIQFVKKECKYYGVKTRFRNTHFVFVGKDKFDGYFDDGNKELVWAKNADNSLENLVHEYCHITQWAEKAEPWINAHSNNSLSMMCLFFEGNHIDPDHFDFIRDLELDNEKRAVALIKKLNIPIDTAAYTKRANAYIMIYNWWKLCGKLTVPKHKPKSNKRLLDAMPDKFSLDYTKLSSKLERIFREEGI